MPQRQVAGHRARLDHRGALPVLAHALVVGHGGVHRDGRWGRRRIGPQPQIGAEHVAVGVARLHQRHQAAGKPRRERALASPSVRSVYIGAVPGRTAARGPYRTNSSVPRRRACPLPVQRSRNCNPAGWRPAGGFRRCRVRCEAGGGLPRPRSFRPVPTAHRSRFPVATFPRHPLSRRSGRWSASLAEVSRRRRIAWRRGKHDRGRPDHARTLPRGRAMPSGRSTRIRATPDQRGRDCCHLSTAAWAGRLALPAVGLRCRRGPGSARRAGPPRPRRRGRANDVAGESPGVV